MPRTPSSSGLCLCSGCVTFIHYPEFHPYCRRKLLVLTDCAQKLPSLAYRQPLLAPFDSMNISMQIPFPERVNPTYALLFAAALSATEILQGTSPAFAGCVFCFIMLAAVAFNVTGGIAFPSGAFVFFNAIFTVILPCTAQAILGQPADALLRAPVRTMEVYLCGLVGMFVAAVFSRRFRSKRAFIASMLPREGLRTAYIGSAVLSILITLYLTFLATGGGNGSFTSFVIQANRFPMLTFVLGVIYTVERTQGRRSVSWPLVGMILYLSLGALFTFSKEQLLGPPFAWAVSSALVRYRINWVNIAVFAVGMFLTITYMVPYAAYGRGFRDTGASGTQTAVYLLTHMDEVREGYESNAVNFGNVRFYDRNRGLLSRLEVFSVDDALIDLTDREGTFGFMPIIGSFANMVPHILWKNKPPGAFGNAYAHEIGILADEDYGTGVSFSPSADAYHEGKMVGVLVVEPIVLMIVFLVLDSVIGDVRRNPVGLLTTILVTRAASEGALYGGPYLIGQPLFTNVLAALFCAYVLPVLGSAFAKSPVKSDAGPVPSTLAISPGPRPQTVSSL
jgi:hypothetical protein